MATTTAQQSEELAVALKDADIVVVLDSIIDPKVTPKADKVYVDGELAKKVNSVTGKGLSTKDFTAALKSKLATMEGTHFKGIHDSLAALETASPAASAEAGSYGYIKHGTDAEKVAMLDGGAWVELASGGGAGNPLTGAQIKALYEGNADTNAFTDALKATLAHIKATKAFDADVIQDNLAAQTQRTAGVSFTPAVPTSPNPDLKKDHIAVSAPVVMEGVQHIPTDHTTAIMSKELMTVGNVLTLLSQIASLTMMDKGTIADINDITETGIYEGTDIQHGPITGKAMVLANKDAAGDYGFFFMGADEVLHTGGKQAGGTAVKWTSIINHNDIGDLHSLMAGKNLVTYLTDLQAQVAALQGTSGHASTEPAAGSWGTVPVACDATEQLITVDLHTFTQPATGNVDLDDGQPHTVRFIKAPTSPKDIPVATTWVWVTPFTGGNPVRMFSNGKEMPSSSFAAYITSGAWIDITFTGGKYSISNVRIPAGASTVSKALLADGSVEMKAGYVPTKDMSIATKKFVEGAGSNAAGLFQFDYKIKMSASDATPPVKFISFDDVDFTKTAKLYINKKDRLGTDMSLFLKGIKTGDWFNIHDNGDIGDFVAFDVTGPVVQNGDIFEIPVSKYDDNGTLTDGERVYVHWQSDEEVIKTITDINDITKEGVYDGNNVAHSPVQGDIVVVATKDSQGNIGLTLKDNTMRVYQGGIPSGGTAHFISVAADHLFGTADPAASVGHDGDLYFKYA